jgi:hypothetical protein
MVKILQKIVSVKKSGFFKYEKAGADIVQWYFSTIKEKAV